MLGTVVIIPIAEIIPSLLVFRVTDTAATTVVAASASTFYGVWIAHGEGEALIV